MKSEGTAAGVVKKTIVGAMAGDIVGSRWEFGGCKTKDFPLFDSHCFATDDTFLTLAIGEALLDFLSTGGDLSALASQKLKEWARAYSNVGYGGSFIDWVINDRSQPYNSGSSEVCEKIHWGFWPVYRPGTHCNLIG